jgi:hypothetical protein
MDALKLHKSIVENYEEYIRSFIDIRDADIRPRFDALAEDRGKQLVAAHQRFSALVDKRRYQVVYPVLPMDILGIYVLLPK